MREGRSALVFYPNNFYELSAGTHRRVYDLLAYFKARGFSIDLLSLNGFTNRWEADDISRKDMADSIRACDWKPSLKDWVKFAGSRVTGGLPDFAIANLKRSFKEMVRSRKYEFVMISYVYWAALADLAEDCVKVIDMHDFVTLNNFLKEGKEFRLGRMFEGEVRALSKFNYALSISEEEKLIFSPFCDKTVFVDVPVFFPERKPHTRKSRRFDILFIGSDNPFNIEGMKWFMARVYPLLPDTVKIAVVGRISRHVPPKDNIELIGHVSDIDSLYNRTRLSFCPLLGGTGLKVKVIEALSYGVPVITTSWGLMGIMQKKNNGCVTADTPEDFAGAIISLLGNDVEYRRTRSAAEDFFAGRYSAEVVYKNLDEIFAKM